MEGPCQVALPILLNNGELARIGCASQHSPSKPYLLEFHATHIWILWMVFDISLKSISEHCDFNFSKKMRRGTKYIAPLDQARTTVLLSKYFLSAICGKKIIPIHQSCLSLPPPPNSKNQSPQASWEQFINYVDTFFPFQTLCNWLIKPIYFRKILLFSSSLFPPKKRVKFKVTNFLAQHMLRTDKFVEVISNILRICTSTKVIFFWTRKLFLTLRVVQASALLGKKM